MSLAKFKPQDLKRFILLRKLHLRQRIVSCFRGTPFYFFLYRSYWHKIIYQNKKAQNNKTGLVYYTALPHIGAGIGHQIANYISGLHHAGYLGLLFAHTPFYDIKWEKLLGFGENEIQIKDLKRIKKRRLPFFEKNDVDVQKKIIDSYKGESVVFIEEQDQPYINNYSEMAFLKRKFYASRARKEDKLIYSKENLNIAIHIRRGDIMVNNSIVNPIHEIRYQDNSYYVNALNCIIDNIKTEKNIYVYIYSQGNKENFPEFKDFNNVIFCLDMNPYNSFLHLVYADILVTSKSAFSYIPTLLSDGIKICPENFWYAYPKSDDWILTDEQGFFDVSKLLNSN
jgi:hypothetical protein